METSVGGYSVLRPSRYENIIDFVCDKEGITLSYSSFQRKAVEVSVQGWSERSKVFWTTGRIFSIALLLHSEFRSWCATHLRLTHAVIDGGKEVSVFGGLERCSPSTFLWLANLLDFSGGRVLVLLIRLLDKVGKGRHAVLGVSFLRRFLQFRCVLLEVAQWVRDTFTFLLIGSIEICGIYSCPLLLNKHRILLPSRGYRFLHCVVMLRLRSEQNWIRHFCCLLRSLRRLLHQSSSSLFFYRRLWSWPRSLWLWFSQTLDVVPWRSLLHRLLETLVLLKGWPSWMGVAHLFHQPALHCC